MSSPTAVAVRYRESADDWVVRAPSKQAKSYPSRREAVAVGRQQARQLGCMLDVETHAGGVQRRPP